MKFLALDFETADQRSDSACAIGLVRVVNGKIEAEAHHLIRPPRSLVLFTDIHGITWNDVADKPVWAELWPEIAPWFEDIEFVAAHNSSFDSRVLRACCEAAGLEAPTSPFVCTVQLARRVWGIFPTKLPNVAQALGLELKHHEALSDARACANIVIKAWEAGGIGTRSPEVLGEN